MHSMFPFAGSCQLCMPPLCETKLASTINGYFYCCNSRLWWCSFLTTCWDSTGYTFPYAISFPCCLLDNPTNVSSSLHHICMQTVLALDSMTSVSTEIQQEWSMNIKQFFKWWKANVKDINYNYSNSYLTTRQPIFSVVIYCISGVLKEKISIPKKKIFRWTAILMKGLKLHFSPKTLRIV